MRRTFRYRIYPNKDQEEKLLSTLDLCRWLYNSALQERRDVYQNNGVSISCGIQIRGLVGRKQESTELYSVHSQVLQDVIFRLDKAFQNFFRRVREKKEASGYPRFKGRDRYNSFAYPQKGFSMDEKTVTLSKIGTIRMKRHRDFFGEIKTCTVVHDGDQWYVCFSCDIGSASAVKKDIVNPVGIDLGIKTFAVMSDSTEIENPKWYQKAEKLLSDRQRILSRRVKGSIRRQKQKILVIKGHRKIRNQRRDFHHKQSRRIVDSYDFIACEDLDVKQMIQSDFAKGVQDAGWNQFIAMIKYKAEEAGITIVAVDPFGTTIDCSSCGFPVYKEIHERTHLCPNCGLEIDRDLNAAKNILMRGLVGLGTSPCGNPVSKET